MLLTSQQLIEYKAVLREEIGEEEFIKMTEQELYDSAIRLLELVQTMLESHLLKQKE
jgi:hypothetical protein